MARLPVPGSDDNTWGDILNAYLLVSHNGDGTVKPSALIAGGSTTQLQYNNAGAFSGIAGATTDGTALTIASSDLKLAGSSSGTTTLNASNTASGSLTLPAATDTLVGRTTTDTLTNKRVSKRTGTVASSATPSINTDNVDFFSITALATNITSFTTNLSGTPTEAQALWIAITDNGSARTLTFGSSFEASGTVALPTTTVISTRLDIGFVWNSATNKWRCIAIA